MNTLRFAVLCAVMGWFSGLLMAGEPGPHDFDVPADWAGKSLKVFARQSGVGVLISGELGGSVRTRAVKGRLTSQAAIEAMLEGTGLAAAYDAPDQVYTVRKARRPAPSPTAPSRAAMGSQDQTIALPAFDVTGDAAAGYIASESVTGTRVATNLSELPFNVNVVTGDFMKDFAAFTLGDEVAYMSSMSPSEEQNQYQLRGFPATTILVDGFRQFGFIDRADISRIEVIKGPDASIYGHIQPGGVVNIITRQPEATASEGLAFYDGSHDFERVDGYATGPATANGTVFYRVDLAEESSRFEQAFRNEDQQTASAALLFRPDADTTVTFKADYSFRHEHRSVPLAAIRETLPDPYRLPGHTFTGWAGLAYNLYNFNWMGPEEYNDNRMLATTLTVDHRFNSVWSLRWSGYWYKDENNRLYTTGGSYYPSLGIFGGSATSGNVPEYDRTPQIDAGSQADLLATFDTGPVSHRLLVTVDYTQVQQRTNDWKMSTANASNPAYNDTFNLNVYAPNYFFVTYAQDPAVYNTAATNEWTSNANLGTLASERASLWSDRVVALVGGRFDYVANRLDNYIPGDASGDWYPSALTYQAGVNVRVADPIVAYASCSSSFDPQAQFDQSGNPLPNEHGDGYEGGAKCFLFDHRLSFTADYYVINEWNILNNGTDPATGQQIIVLSGKEQAKGEEFDFNWQPIDGLQLLGGAGHVHSVILEDVQDPYATGTTPRRVPDADVGVAGRYSFSGALKGLYLTADERYYSKTLPEDLGSGRTLTPSATNPVINNPMPNGVLPYPNLPAGATVTSGATVTVNDGREKIFNAPYGLTGVGAGYAWAGHGYRNKIQFNIKNLLNRRYTYGAGVPGDPITLIVEDSVSF